MRNDSELGEDFGGASEQPNTVGQRVLALLHASGPSRLSSPVNGMDGVLPIPGYGAAPSSTMVDMRWVQTHIARGSVW